MSDNTANTDPLRDDLRTVIQALSAAVQALTQATQVLYATSNQMIQAMQKLETGTAASPAVGPAAQILVWEDDPFSESVPTTDPVAAPTIAESLPPTPPPNLGWQIGDPRPAPAQHAPGTAEFRYWNAEAALARGVGFWLNLLPSGTRWSTFAPSLRVTLSAGQRLNARYSRFSGLEFFQRTVGAINVFSAESPDVVCHELGHAILDAMRPELFDAANTEVDGFHEAFGDISSMLVALQIPSFRQKVLTETQGRLSVNSRLSRVAEQLGWGIRQLSRDAVDRDSLRNASNSFLYRSPLSLPAESPASMLSTEPHSFARIFTGAFLDTLAGMVTLLGTPTESTLQTASRDLGQLLVDGILTAPITPNYYSQLAASIVQASRVRNNGRYRPAVLRAFVARGILALEAVNDLEIAAIPTVQPLGSATPGGGLGMAAADLSPGTGGSPTLLAFDNLPVGFHCDASTAPALPLRPVRAEFMDAPILVHAAEEQERFRVAPDTPGTAGPAPYDPDDVARRFVKDLIQRGRVDPGPSAGIVAALNMPGGDNKTHKLECTPDGMVLKRIHFDCGCCRRH